jgi:hypothetical protein
MSSPGPSDQLIVQIHWFREDLAKRDVEYHEFIDPECDLGIIVCTNSARNRRRLESNPLAPSQPSLPAPISQLYTPSQSRTCSQPHGPDTISDAITQPQRSSAAQISPIKQNPSTTISEVPQPSTSPNSLLDLVYTTVDRNKKAQQRRVKRKFQASAQDISGSNNKPIPKRRQIQTKLLSMPFVPRESEDEAEPSENGEDDTEPLDKDNTEPSENGENDTEPLDKDNTEPSGNGEGNTEPLDKDDTELLDKDNTDLLDKDDAEPLDEGDTELLDKDDAELWDKEEAKPLDKEDNEVANSTEPNYLDSPENRIHNPSEDHPENSTNNLLDDSSDNPPDDGLDESSADLGDYSLQSHMDTSLKDPRPNGPDDTRRSQLCSRVSEHSAISAWFRSQAVDGHVLSQQQQDSYIKKAKAIAGPESVQDWQRFIESWRGHGSLTLQNSSSSEAGVEVLQMQDVPTDIARFCYAYQQVQLSEVATSFRAISLRIQLTKLYDLYCKAESSGILDSLPRSSGVTCAVQVRQYLFGCLYPKMKGIASPATNNFSKKEWFAFTSQLRNALRWYTIREQFGYGVIGLLPNRIVSNTWVHKLKSENFDLWLRVIHQFNPQCIEAGRHWADTLALAFAGRSPPPTRKALEDIPTLSLKTYSDPSALFSQDIQGSISTHLPNNLATQGNLSPPSHQISTTSEDISGQPGIPTFSSSQIFGNLFPDITPFAQGQVDPNSSGWTYLSEYNVGQYFPDSDPTTFEGYELESGLQEDVDI